MPPASTVSNAVSTSAGAPPPHPAASGGRGLAARLDRLERRLDVGGVPTAARGDAPPVGPSAHASQARPAGPAAPAGPAGPPPGSGGAPVSAPPRTVSDYTPA